MIWYDLQELLPPVFAAVQSMYETAVAENEELKAAYSIRNAIFSNFFVQTCDVKTLQYWEQLLDIELFGTETIEERRAMILLYLVNNWQITKPFVEYQMEQFFGEGNYSFEYNPENNLIVDIHMYDASYNNVRRFLRWFEKVCPAHISWDNSVTYRSEETVDLSTNEICATIATCHATYDSPVFPTVHSYHGTQTAVSITPNASFNTGLEYDSGNLYVGETTDGQGNVTRYGWDAVEGSDYLDVFFYLNNAEEAKYFGANDYWGSAIIDQNDKSLLENFGVSVSLYGTSANAHYCVSRDNNTGFTFEPVGLYSGLRTGELSADMSNFHCAVGPYVKGSLYDGLCIWSDHAYTTLVLTWKCRITRNL